MTIKPGTRSSTVASIFMAGALAANPAWAQQGAQEAVQVSGADLQAWLSKGFVYAAEEHTNGSVFFIVGKAGERTQFFDHPTYGLNTVKGTQRVVGDMLCATWSASWAGVERCREWYRVGENKYESREKGSRTKAATLYIISSRTPSPATAQPSAQEPVQVSGADLQAWLSNGFVYAAEEHTNGSVFLIVGAASDRAMFYSHPMGAMNTLKGTQRVVGDTLCAKWPGGSQAGEERCREWYRVGENRYEARDKGSSMTATVYIVSSRTPGYIAK